MWKLQVENHFVTFKENRFSLLKTRKIRKALYDPQFENHWAPRSNDLFEPEQFKKCFVIATKFRTLARNTSWSVSWEPLSTTFENSNLFESEQSFKKCFTIAIKLRTTVWDPRNTSRSTGWEPLSTAFEDNDLFESEKVFKKRFTIAIKLRTTVWDPRNTSWSAENRWAPRSKTMICLNPSKVFKKSFTIATKLRYQRIANG